MHVLLVLALLPQVELRHLGEVVALWARAHDEATWRAAAEQLDAHADSPDLALAAVAAWKHAVDAAPPAKRGPYDKPNPQPLSDDAERLLHAIDVALPGSLDRATLLHERGIVFYRFDQLPDAARAFHVVVDTSPSSDVAEASATLWLDSLNLLHDYDELLAATVRMRVDRALLAHRHDLAQTLAKLYAQGERSWLHGTSYADSLISAASYCASVYMDAFRIAPAALPARAELLFEAALCSYKDGDRDEATRRFTNVIELAPQSPFAAKARSYLP